MPEYRGGSLVNLVATVAGRFGPDSGHAPLSDPPAGVDAADHVVLVVCDALGAGELRRHVDGGVMPFVAGLLAGGRADLRQISSVFPSTTAAALSSIHTGRTPAEHGYLGYSLWLDADEGPTDMLKAEDVRSGRPRPTPPGPASIYTRLAEAGVACRAVGPGAIAGSRLSRWHFAGADFRPYHSPNTVPSLVLEALDVSGPAYVTAYWSDHDTLCHVYGPDSAAVADEAAAFDAMLARLVLHVGRSPTGARTLILVTGDHGQAAFDPEAAVYLDDLGVAPAAGERGAVYLRERAGIAEVLRRYGTVHRMEDVWRQGWFGGAPADPAFARRTGDLLAVPAAGRQFIWRGGASEPPRLWRGGHGGWSPEEMLVPLLAIRP